MCQKTYWPFLSTRIHSWHWNLPKYITCLVMDFFFFKATNTQPLVLHMSFIANGLMTSHSLALPLSIGFNGIITRVKSMPILNKVTCTGILLLFNIFGLFHLRVKGLFGKVTPHKKKKKLWVQLRDSSIPLIAKKLYN